MRTNFKLDPQKLFLQKYRTRKYAKGEVVIVQGETPAAAYVIKIGVVKTYGLSITGDEKPISYDIQGEVLPLAWVFGKVRSAPYYYEAFTNCELYIVPREDYKEFVYGSAEQLATAFDRLVNQYLDDQLRMHALEQSKASDKLLHTLHFLCLRFGKDVRKNTVKIQLPLTQQDLANFIGLTRETTGLELNRLHAKGIVASKRQHFIVKTDRLHELLDQEYDQSRLKTPQVTINF